MGSMTTRRPIVRRTVEGSSRRPDTLAVEEPLEIRINGAPYTVTMRTPGHDVDLALGFLVSESVVRRPEDVLFARHCPGPATQPPDGEPPGEDPPDGEPADEDEARAAAHNVVEVSLAPGVAPPITDRFRLVSSACGVCGTRTVDTVMSLAPHLPADDGMTVRADVIDQLPDRLRAAQRAFARTGGLHAAGLFTATGEPICVREDVGRHNAVDKVVGRAFQRRDLPLRSTVLQVSGRASFELVQKAWLAGCPVLAAVSAPSSLAVDLAVRAGMTLIGFSRGTSYNIYSGEHRIG